MLDCAGKLLDLSYPQVMGILNVTPDSFSDGGRFLAKDKAVAQAKQMVADGASIIDVGGESTRPGAAIVPVEQEIERVVPVIEAICSELDVVISIDTFRATVAKIAVDAGVSIVNDISGGEMDKKMFAMVGQLKVPYILMHMKGTPQTMQKQPHYENMLKEIMLYFAEKIEQLKDLDVHDIIIDPGFGFGKTLEHNYQLLRQLAIFKTLKFPLLVGISRKSMIHKLLEINSNTALNGTTVLHTIALLNGANILRVHDVKEAMEAIRIVKYYSTQKQILQ